MNLATLAALFLGAAPAQDAKGATTFTKDVAPIVYARCTSCHRDGEVAPFPLITYVDVKKRAKFVLEQVEGRRMPPWKPEVGHGDFVGDRRLKAEEIAVFRRWVDGGCAEGDAAALPAPPKFTDGWAHGEPDLVVKMPEAFTVPAEGRDVYRAFAIPLNLTEDKYVRAVQYRPSNRRVVHHALMFLDILGESRKRDAADPGPGFKGQQLGLGALSGGGLGGWAPGGLSHPFPDGIAKEIKKGADLVLQLHLSPSGKPEKEQSEIGLWFAKAAPERIAAMIPIANRNVDIAPGAKAAKISQSILLPVDLDLIGIIPHAHYLGKECRAWATTPEGKEIPLIWIKDWDFDWQEQYQYKSLLRVPKGSTVRMEWTYDNSAENPRNPSSPPRRVRHGEQTEDEMAMVFFQVAPQNRADLMRLMIGTMGGARKKP